MAARTLELLLVNPLRFFASAVPFLLAVFLVAFANVPLSLTGELLPAPMLGLAAVYFWLLVRPDLMTPVAVLMLGLLEDLLSGGPPGLWATGYLAAYAFADRQRDILAGLSSLGTIIGFAGMTVVAAATAYGLSWVVYLHAPPLPPLFVESILTVVFYPLVAVASSWVHKRVVGPMRGND